MKVIHISRKKKIISRTSYEWYRAKNKIKAGYHKVGVFIFSLALAMIVGVLADAVSALTDMGNPAIVGFVSMGVSFCASMGVALYSHYSKTVVFWGILAVGTFNCNYGLGNTGTDCTPKMGAPKKFWFMNYYNAAGTQNRISLTQPGTISCSSTATLTGVGTTFLTTFTIGDIIIPTGTNTIFSIIAIASNTSLTLNVSTTIASTTYNQITNPFYFTALCNHPDPTRRIYPAPFVKNGDNTRADFIMQVWEDNTEEAVLQGVRKVMGIIPKSDASPQLSGKLQTFSTNNSLGLGLFVIDYANNFHIVDILDGFAYPMRVDENSFRAIYNPGKVKEGAKIDVMFNIHSNEIDSNMNAIAASNFGPGVNLGNINGLKDASGAYSNFSHSTNKLTAAFTTLYGDAITPTQVHGLSVNSFVSKVTGVAGQIACTAGTDIGTDIAVASVTEQTDTNGKPNGTYIIVLTSPSATDILAINVNFLGYDWSAVNVSTVTLT